MLLQLIILITVLVGAVTAAVWARTAQTHPAEVLSRLRGTPAATGPLFVPPVGAGPFARFSTRVAQIIPGALTSTERQEKLVQAGFGSPVAPAIYVTMQLLLAVLGAAVMFTLTARRGVSVGVVGAILGIIVGLMLPSAVVARIRTMRQERMRRGLPDVLDLLLVCVEAGISLDAAILRVGREVALVHPDLSEELLTIGRKQNAGIPREEALRGMYPRTGLLELRALTANIIQSERWGTSIARVLRVDSEVLRRQRREAAEKRAALASTKMIFPLGLLILPALLIVIGGPMMLTINEVFHGTGH